MFFVGFACWSFSIYYSSIGTLEGSEWVIGLFTWYDYLVFFNWFACWSFSRYVSSIGALRGSAGGVAFPIKSAMDINASLCKFTSVTSGMAGAGFFSAWIKYCVE